MEKTTQETMMQKGLRMVDNLLLNYNQSGNQQSKKPTSKSQVPNNMFNLWGKGADHKNASQVASTMQSFWSNNGMNEEIQGKKIVKFDANLEKVKYIEKISRDTDPDEFSVDKDGVSNDDEKETIIDVQSVETQTEKEEVEEKPVEVKDFCDAETITDKSDVENELSELKNDYNDLMKDFRYMNIKVN